VSDGGRTINTHTHLPAGVSSPVVGEVVDDPAVDVAQRHALTGRVVHRHADERRVRVARLPAAAGARRGRAAPGVGTL